MYSLSNKHKHEKRHLTQELTQLATEKIRPMEHALKLAIIMLHTTHIAIKIYVV